MFLIHPWNLSVLTLHQLFLQFLTIKTLPLFIFAMGFEKIVGLLNNILSSREIIEFTAFN